MSAALNDFIVFSGCVSSWQGFMQDQIIASHTWLLTVKHGCLPLRIFVIITEIDLRLQ